MVRFKKKIGFLPVTKSINAQYILLKVQKLLLNDLFQDS